MLKSIKCACQGIACAIAEERNMRIHCVMMVLVIIAGWVLKISKYDWLICILLFGLVIGAELMNTAIEALCDMISTEFHPQIKKAKDIAAGAVWFVSLCAACIGLWIFVPKFLALIC